MPPYRLAIGTDGRLDHQVQRTPFTPWASTLSQDFMKFWRCHEGSLMDESDRTRIRTITPGTFSSLEPGPWGSRHGKHPACCEALSNACLIFSVTLYRLSFLLGTAHPQKIYAWMGCESKPSTKYLLRLIKLHQLQLAGLQLDTVRSVNWDGVIRYHPVLDFNTGKFVERTSEELPGGVEEHDALGEWMSMTPSWA